MDIDNRLRAASPPTSEPSYVLQQQVLTKVFAQTTPPKQGWGLILYWFAHFLVRYPIPVLTVCWALWMVSTFTIPIGTEIGLAQFFHVILSWR